MKKVMFVCSDGGHLSEMEVFQQIFDDYDATLVVEKTNRDVSWAKNVYILKKGTRKKLIKYLFIFGYNVMKSIFIFLKEKPSVIVTTGSHTAVPLCYIGAMFKRKIIFIESIARVNSKSLTGKLIEKKCDKIFVQWPEMLTVYQNSVYMGPVL